MGNKPPKLPEYASYEALLKELKAANIPNDTQVIVAIDAKGEAAPNERKAGSVPDKLEESNTLDGALECCGRVLGTDPAFVYLFGSREAEGKVVPTRPVRGPTELLARWHSTAANHHASEEPLSIKAVLEQAIKHNDQTRQFHLVLIFTSHGIEAPKEEEMAALKLAARYPLSIVIVKTGSSPDKGLENLALGKGRFFDNVTLVDFKDVAAKDTKTREDYMALQCMKKVPTQYAILKKKQGYMPPAEVPVFEDPAWEDERRYQESLQTEAKLLVFGRNAKTGPVRLGRGAFWDPLTKQLYYTDILGKLVHIYNEEGKTDTVINACGTVGFAVPDENGKLYVGTNAGIELVDGLDVTKVDTKKNSGDYWISPYADIEKGKKAKTINCGTVDAKGRIWVTTGETSVQLREPTGGIFCCHGEQMVFTPLEAGLTHIGGIAFSIDGKTLYAADLSLNSIWAYEHDVSTGVLSKPRVLFEATTQVKGVVSDVCLDTEGKLWVPHLGGGAVVRYNPEDGKAIKIMRVPSLLCDSVAFGGENLEKLYIVTGSETVSMDREYYAGSLFVIDSVGVRGAPIRPFKPKVNDNNAGGSQNPAEGGAAADEAEGKEQGEESTLSEPLENKHSLDSGGDKDEIGS